VNSRDDLGQTPLYHSVSKCPVDILKKLVAKGADINVMCQDTTPLMLAAMADNADNIKYLVSAGADIGIKKKANGVTADQLARSREMEDYLGGVKKKYDAIDAAGQKARAEIEAIREKERQALAEKADASEAIACLITGTKNAMRVPKPLCLRPGRKSSL
jgi:uncharacterized protein YdbL (DUF1318 family)